MHFLTPKARRTGKPIHTQREKRERQTQVKILASCRSFRTDSAKLKVNLLSGQLSVHLTKCIHFVINIFAIQKNSGDLVTIDLGTDTLANNLGGEYKVLEHILMHGGKSPGTRPLLSNTGSPGWRWENAALAKEDDMSVRELLLKLTSKAIITRRDVSDLGPFDNWDGMCLDFGSYP